MPEHTSAAAAPLLPQFLRIGSMIAGSIIVGKGWASADDWAQFSDHAINLIGTAMTVLPPMYLAVKGWIVRAKAGA